MLRVVLTQIC